MQRGKSRGTVFGAGADVAGIGAPEYNAPLTVQQWQTEQARAFKEQAEARATGGERVAADTAAPAKVAAKAQGGLLTRVGRVAGKGVDGGIGLLIGASSIVGGKQARRPAAGGESFARQPLASDVAGAAGDQVRQAAMTGIDAGTAALKAATGVLGILSGDFGGSMDAPSARKAPVRAPRAAGAGPAGVTAKPVRPRPAQPRNPILAAAKAAPNKHGQADATAAKGTEKYADRAIKVKEKIGTKNFNRAMDAFSAIG